MHVHGGAVEYLKAMLIHYQSLLHSWLVREMRKVSYNEVLSL